MRWIGGLLVALRKEYGRGVKEITAGTPPPVSFARLANKGLMHDAARKSGREGLKVAEFSVGCNSSVRVARKGLREGELTVEGLKVERANILPGKRGEAAGEALQGSG